MKTSTKVTVAGVATGALVLAGGTYALWSDSATINGTAVNTGHLDLNTSAQEVYDISTYQQPTEGATESWKVTDGTANKIDPASFVFVPEDLVAVVVPITVDLNGSNLAAELKVNLDPQTTTDGFTARYVGIVEADGTADASGGNNHDATPYNPFVFTDDSTSNNKQFYAVWTVSFTDDDTDGLTNNGNMDRTLATVLANTSVTLQQVRPSGAGTGGSGTPTEVPTEPDTEG